MKKRTLLGAGIGALMMAGMIPVSATADTVKMRIAHWLPPAHHMTRTMRLWADALEAASNGEIEVEVMTTPLGKPNGQYDLVKNGVVDIVYSVAAYHPKRFWKLMGAEMPFAAPTAEVAGVAAWRWYNETGFMAQDTSDAKILGTFSHAPHMYHSNKPLVTLEDFKDKKVRAGGTGVKIAKTLGAVPVGMPPGQSHEAMAKGTIDVSQFPWETVAGFRLDEVTSHHLVIPGGTYSGIFFLAMSPKTWEKLTETQKAAVDKVSGEWGSRFLSQKWDEAEAAGRLAAEAAGNVITVLSDEETDKLREMLAPITQEWLQQAQEAGLDGEALLQKHKDIVADLSRNDG